MRGGKSTTEGRTVQHVPFSQQALPKHGSIQMPFHLSGFRLDCGFSPAQAVPFKPSPRSQTKMINVETVVLPDSLEGTSDGVYGVTVSQGLTINCFQCVRVWYRE